MTPTREIFWNISGGADIVHLVMIVPLLVFFYGLYKHYRLWQLGRKGKPLQDLPGRIRSVIVTIVTHRAILRDRYAGLMHLGIFIGFIFLTLGTAVVAFQDNFLRPVFNGNILHGPFYLWFKIVLDIAGAMVLVGILMAFYRRLVQKPTMVDTRSSDVFLLSLILAIILTGFALEGLRLVATNPQEALWSPVGLIFGSVLGAFLSSGAVPVFHRAIWWLHMGLAFFFIAYFPFSKLIHILTSSLNLLVNSFDATVSLQPMDFKAARYGSNQVRDFESNALLAMDACTECARCQNACPAHLSRKSLSPKNLTLSLQSEMRKAMEQDTPANLIGQAVTEDEIWSCTTCSSCSKHCPVSIEPVRNVVELRRHLSLMVGRVPAGIERVYRNIEIFGDSLGMGKINRDELVQSARLPKPKPDESPIEVAFWIGCQGYFHDRNRKSVVTLLKLLQKLNVKFTVLGRDELCCGDVARRTGNEYLFKAMAEKNIALLEQQGIRKIVTHCPHCFNVLKNEYPQLGGNFEVCHYTTLLEELFEKNPPDFKNNPVVKATYHDPCYLSRYNGIMSGPRKLLTAIPGVDVVEMERSREESFCCGAGGGVMWLGNQPGERINEMRAGEACETNADCIITACPYCFNMMEDGVKGLSKERSVQVVDLVELLEGAII